MSALSVVTIPPEFLSMKENVLRGIAKEISPLSEWLPTCRSLALEMFEVMYAADGAALAAPQAGVSLRMVVLDPAGIRFGPHVLINPLITQSSELEVEAEEGCLSLPGVVGKVPRASEVILDAYSLRGEKEQYKAKG